MQKGMMSKIIRIWGWVYIDFERIFIFIPRTRWNLQVQPIFP
jgi:hypothetical protein